MMFRRGDAVVRGPADLGRQVVVTVCARQPLLPATPPALEAYPKTAARE
jgi:hypothetical protein